MCTCYVCCTEPILQTPINNQGTNLQGWRCRFKLGVWKLVRTSLDKPNEDVLLARTDLNFQKQKSLCPVVMVVIACLVFSVVSWIHRLRLPLEIPSSKNGGAKKKKKNGFQLEVQCETWRDFVWQKKRSNGCMEGFSFWLRNKWQKFSEKCTPDESLGNEGHRWGGLHHIVHCSFLQRNDPFPVHPHLSKGEGLQRNSNERNFNCVLFVSGLGVPRCDEIFPPGCWRESIHQMYPCVQYSDNARRAGHSYREVQAGYAHVVTAGIFAVWSARQWRWE